MKQSVSTQEVSNSLRKHLKILVLVVLASSWVSELSKQGLRSSGQVRSDVVIFQLSSCRLKFSVALWAAKLFGPRETPIHICTKLQSNLTNMCIHPTTIIIGDLWNTAFDTLWLLQGTVQSAVSNLTNGTLVERGWSEHQSERGSTLVHCLW